MVDKYLQIRQSDANTANFKIEHKFAGRLRSGENISGPFSIFLIYSEANEFRPFGYIVGNENDYECIELFFQTSKVPCQIESISEKEGREKILINAHIKSIGYRAYPEDEAELLYYEIAIFDIFDFYIDRIFNGSKNTKRRATYFMETPRNIWLSDSIRIQSYDGTTTSKMPNKNFTLNLPYPLSLEVGPHYIFNKSKIIPNIRVEGSLFSINIFDNGWSVSDEIFLKFADSIVDKLSLVMGFLARTQISRYARSMISGQIHSIFQDDTDKIGDPYINFDEIQISAENIRTFTRDAITAFDALERQKLNLRLPILLYISGHGPGYIGEKFISLFRSLEGLVDMLSSHLVGLENLNRDEARKIKEMIKENFSNDLGDRLQWVLDKVPELTRPGFMKKLLKILSDKHIKIDDIGGKEGLSEMYKVRNSLIHKGIEPDIIIICREYGRLQTVLDRLFLSMLGWSGSDQTPTYRGQLNLTEIDTTIP
jgi:hypothetical protein